MIEVKIASVLGRRGVEGMRWVLLDPQEPGIEAAAQRPADGTAALAAQRSADALLDLHRHARIEHGPQQRLLLSGLKLLLSLTMLGLAVWAANQHLGAPGRAGGEAQPTAPGASPMPASSPSPLPARPLITTQA
ncbi:MAG: hypothetical protein KBC94_28305 [Pseudacidovorax sp.]|uniref:hypothetical protein n=1 Tax=Pseudacidovorax sp. TaxID=1934311 RepID=UPI001B45810E|nr:hypothetical protein [Pseudacidovorax sp.]MBP6898338.1 hypothetical protein [Pseudacidovorax sp.]MBP6901073.1 hypothetical protein [Burkholderiaceae bacterium]